MVVAGVYLIILMPNKLPAVLRVLLLASNMVGQMDVKKNIAYSTSIHLMIIILLSGCEMYSVVVMYIITHRMVKGQLFQSSGYEIHGLRSQDVRKFSIKSRTMIMLFAMFILSALVGIVILGSKELIVLGSITILMIILVSLSFLYTLVYGNKLSVIYRVGENEGLYVYLVMLASIAVLYVNLGSWLRVVVFGVVFIRFYGNSIVTIL